MLETNSKANTNSQFMLMINFLFAMNVLKTVNVGPFAHRKIKLK